MHGRKEINGRTGMEKGRRGEERDAHIDGPCLGVCEMCAREW